MVEAKILQNICKMFELNCFLELLTQKKVLKHSEEILVWPLITKLLQKKSKRFQEIKECVYFD